MHYTTIDSPVGELLVGADAQGRITDLHFPGGAGAGLPASNGLRQLGAGSRGPAAVALDRLRRQLEEYFAGERREFELALAPSGTTFRQAVWRALRAIPYGETASYTEIGRVVGKAHAARAVGQANHHNPIAIVIPCHRVIAADGSLGGYGGGLDRKRQLLALEGAHALS
jgi:methylated-DNA-[protein]-cysteine S-methyltransferase